MVTGTTALLRTIDQQAEQSRQDAWDDRANRTRRRPPKWACDFLVDTGGISPEQHATALRFANLIERGFAGDPFPGVQAQERVAHVVWDDSFAADVNRTAKAWDRATSREAAQAADRWVRSALKLQAGNYKRRRVTLLGTLTRLFAFDGYGIVGARGSWKMIRGASNCPTAEAWVCVCLDALAEYFSELDAAYSN